MAIIVKNELLKKTFRSVTSFVDESRIRFSDGLQIEAMDKVGTLYTKCNLNEGDCKQFDNIGLDKIGSDISHLNSVVNLAEGNESLIKLNKDLKDRLILSFDNIVYSYSTIDPDAIVKVEQPRPVLPVKIEMDTADFSETITAASFISDYLEITTNNDSIEFRTSSDGNELSNDPDSITINSFSENCSTRISMEYLTELKTAIPGDTIELMFGDEEPIKIISHYGDKSYFMCFIAPMVTG